MATVSDLLLSPCVWPGDSPGLCNWTARAGGGICLGGSGLTGQWTGSEGELTPGRCAHCTAGTGPEIPWGWSAPTVCGCTAAEVGGATWVRRCPDACGILRGGGGIGFRAFTPSSFLTGRH